MLAELIRETDGQWSHREFNFAYHPRCCVNPGASRSISRFEFIFGRAVHHLSLLNLLTLARRALRF